MGLTIAYLEQELNSLKSEKIWNGIIKTANELDINIVAFSGGVLGKAEYNIAYELCNLEMFDGIISWASTDNEYLDYYAKFKNIPFLSMSLKMAKYPYVSINCYSGMKDALIHLIKDHNITKIAFLRGPEKHEYADERYKAYLDVHKEFNIKLDDSLITPCGNWSNECGKNGIKILLDERDFKPGKDIEAVACVNDGYAQSAIDELKIRGFSIPGDISVIGFNNSLDAANYNPPITSVNMPHEEQGVLAVKTIVSMIKGEKINYQNDLNSNLCVYRSCGCKSFFVENIKSNLSEEKSERKSFFNFKKNYKGLKSNALKKFENNKEAAAAEISEKFFKLSNSSLIDKNIINVLSLKFVDSFILSLENRNNIEFIKTIEEILVFICGYKINIELWHEAVTALRSNFMKFHFDPDIEKAAYAFFEQARVVIGEVEKRNDSFIALQKNNQSEKIRVLGSKLSTTFNVGNIIDILLAELKNIDFSGFYLVLYENIIKYTFPQTPPDRSKLVLAYSAYDNILVKGENIIFPTKEILPKNVFPKSRKFCLFLLPLIFDKKQIGYFILEIGPMEKYIYSLLSEQLSSSLMGAILMEERINSKIFLEKTLENLRNKAVIISDHSEQINNNVSGVSASMEEMAANIKEISSRAEDVMKIVASAVEMTDNASLIINNLNENSKKIFEITNFINDIAQKTNVLALNANIEAARAKESGHGFKIVSMEIKKLSNLTVKSTKDIENLLKTIKSGCGDSYKVVNDIEDIIKNISTLSFVIKEAVSQQTIAASSVSQQLIEASNGSKEIFEAIKEVAYQDNEDKNTV